MAVFRANPTFPVRLLAQAKMHLFMDGVGKAGLEVAKREAEKSRDTGALMDSLDVEKVPGAGRRVIVKVRYWWAVEYGVPSRGIPPRAFLRPIKEQLRLKDRPTL